MTRPRKTKRVSVWIAEAKCGPHWEAITGSCYGQRKDAAAFVSYRKLQGSCLKYRVRRYDRVDRAGK